jgi:hypothetical protein
MANFTNPKTQKPVSERLTGDALEAINTQVNTLTTQVGTMTKGVAVANATDEASAVTQLNALLASLRTAGVIAP